MTSEQIFSVAELQVSYKLDTTKKRARVACSRDAYNILRQHWSQQIAWREEFYILALNRTNEALGFFRVSEGGVHGTVADPKVIFSVAFGCGASSMILAHNHPSGNLQPSQADKDLTRKLRDIGKLLDLSVLDHVILTPDDTYMSFADEGIL